MDVATPEVEHDMARCPQQVVDALLLSHDADVADQVTAAALKPFVGGQHLQALEARSAAHDEYPLWGHAVASDGYPSVRLVGGDRHVGGAEGPRLELQHQAMEEITPAELGFVELGAEIVMIEDELLAEQLEEAADQEQQ